MLESPAEIMQAQLVQGVQDANTTRYISAVGLVLLLYNHIITFPDEVELIWNARPSFAKQIFLLNRYVVSVSQICVSIFMNHFTEDTFSDASCRVVITSCFVLGICSVACGNVLVILRVITLWDRDQYIARLMALGFCASFLSTVVFMIVVLSNTLSGFTYVPFAHTCVSTMKSPALPGVWASPLIFEVMVLTFVMWNALNRPRGSSTPLVRVLHRDGIVCFVTLAGLRIANLIIAIIARPTLVLSGVFFVWAMTTLVLDRSLLNIHKVSADSSHMRLPSRSLYRGRRPGNIIIPTRGDELLEC